MNNKDILSRLLFAEKYFSTPRYVTIVKEARSLFLQGKNKKTNKLLDHLPTTECLLKELIEKLRDKPVYKTLNKILSGEKIERYTALKGLSSLFTHAVIEGEKGRKEYEVLFSIIMDRLNEILYCE